MVTCINKRQYHPGEKVLSLVSRPPELEVGTICTIIKRWVGALYAVRLKSGEIYRWLDITELESLDPSKHTLNEGDFAAITAHGFNNHRIPVGSAVQVCRIVEDIDYYSVSVGGGTSFYWLPSFELSHIL